MAVSASIYSNANAASASVSVDFVGDVLVKKFGASDSTIDYYLKFTTGARDDASAALPVKIALELSDLALNGNVQSQSNVSSAYANVDALVSDYIYDYIHGHTADQYLSGCTLQRPMKFR